MYFKVCGDGSMFILDRGAECVNSVCPAVQPIRYTSRNIGLNGLLADGQ